jgi:hypothetical protein
MEYGNLNVPQCMKWSQNLVYTILVEYKLTQPLGENTIWRRRGKQKIEKISTIWSDNQVHLDHLHILLLHCLSSRLCVVQSTYFSKLFLIYR